MGILRLTLILSFLLGVFSDALSIAFAAPALPAKPVVVLVPGFFNSVTAGYIDSSPPNTVLDIQPYFSIDIVRAFQNKGMQVFVVNTLAPIGSIQTNGERVYQFLKNLRANPDYKLSPLFLVSHSAGGLYSLYAINKDPSLNVKSLVTIATPFKGAPLANRVSSLPMISQLMALINMRSISELSPGKVENFMKTVKVPASLVLKSYASSQKRSLFTTDSRNLSWPMMIISSLMSEDSDGLVGVSSAQSSGLRPFTKVKDTLALEHWEQVQDYRVFAFLGVINIGYIRQQQISFYSGLATEFRRSLSTAYQ